MTYFIHEYAQQSSNNLAKNEKVLFNRHFLAVLVMYQKFRFHDQNTFLITYYFEP